MRTRPSGGRGCRRWVQWEAGGQRAWRPSPVELRLGRVLVAGASGLPDLRGDHLGVPRSLVERDGRRRRMRPSALGFMQLVHPLEHLHGRQLLVDASAQCDFAPQPLGIAVVRCGQPSFSVPPRGQRGFDRLLSSDHELGPTFGPRVGGDGTDARGAATAGGCCPRAYHAMRGDQHEQSSRTNPRGLRRRTPIARMRR
jgi:hypothetical protein